MLKQVGGLIAGLAICSTAVAGQVACTYDECALRLEPAWFGETIVRGQRGVKVGTVSAFGGPRLGHIIQLPDSARMYIEKYDRNYTPGALISTLGGIAATVSWFVAAANEGTGERRNWTIIALAATGVSWYGARRLEVAQRALSRGIWWYNRDLPR
ncbi:MAG: hypothetical protein ABIV11_04585 [Gemmatimonadaceae bacterium]